MRFEYGRLIVLLALMTACTPLEHALLQRDVNFIEDTITENYPYLPVHWRRDHFDWLESLDRLRKHEKVAFDGTNRVEYLSQFLEGLNGHVHLIDAENFPYYAAGYGTLAKTNPQYAPWAQVLSRPDVLAAYGATRLSVEQTKPQPMFRNQAYAFTKQVDQGVLVVKVPTFDAALADTEGPLIVDFLRQHSRSDALIVFDVRGNGGGSDTFWIQYLVKPLISRPLEQTSVVFYQGGEASQPFLSAKNVVLRACDRLPYQYSSVETNRIEPAGAALPHDRIVVLMDRSNFSAAETFVAFCKATGFATTVGTRSGGDGIGFDPILVELPYSHLVLALPICAALNPDGGLDYEFGTMPDIVLAGVDSLQFVKDHRGELSGRLR